MVRASGRGWRIGFHRCDADDAVTMMVRASDGCWRVVPHAAMSESANCWKLSVNLGLDVLGRVSWGGTRIMPSR